MKRIMRKGLLPLFLVLAIACGVLTMPAAPAVALTTGIVTEHFSDEVSLSRTFTTSLIPFSLGGQFSVSNVSPYGWTGNTEIDEGTDDWFVDNYSAPLGAPGVVGWLEIDTATSFQVSSIYIFPGVTGDWVSNTGDVIIRGLLDGVQKFEKTVLSADINVAGFVCNGWTFVDLSSYSSHAIDKLEFELKGSLRYLAIDAFKHESTMPNAAPVGLPTVSGTATQGQLLTASTAGISDGDGLGAFAYQWQVSSDGSTGWADIVGAIDSTYVLTSSEAGKYVRVRVSYTDGGGTAEVLVSSATSRVVPLLTGIAVTTQPSKLSYVEGTDGTLALNGMVVTESYSDGSNLTVSFADGTAAGYTASPANGTALTEALNHNTKVTITHTASGKTAQTAALTVNLAPTVTNVTSTKADGTYGIGETIELTVTFSEPVTVAGTPQLALETGVVDRTASYSNGSGTATLTFTYTTQAGDASADLDYRATGSLILNGGTIARGETNADLALPSLGTAGSLAANKAIVIEAFPTVTLSANTPSVAENGGTSTITVILSEVSTQDVVVTLSYSGTATSGSDYGTASTTITVPAGNPSAQAATGVMATQDADPEGNETIIIDVTGVSKGFENGVQQQTITIVDDDIASVSVVSSSTADGTYGAGMSINVGVTFSHAVTVTGTPRILLETGTTDRTASYMSGSGSTTLYFMYLVQLGDTSSDLDYVAANSLTLNGGTIMNSGQAANLALAAPGTASSLAGQKAIVIDAKAPTASIVVADGALKAGETSLVTVTFSEAVTGFTNGDLIFPNATLSDVISGDGGVTWTATFTPTADVEDASNTISLNQSGVHDYAGNAGVGIVDSNNYAIDTKRPTAIIEVADSALKAGETSLVTITFSEAVSGFTNGDLTIANGTLSAVISGDGGVNWTATFTPAAGVEDASNVISLDQTGVQDGAVNIGSGAANSNNYAIDTKRPTVIILVADSALQAGETSLVTITFSEAISGFTNGDLTIVNGTLSAVISGDGGVTWTATFTPTAEIEDASNIISLDQTGVQDGAANIGSGAADSNNYAIDTKRPTAIILVADSALQAGETSLVTITFSAAVTGFSNGDLAITNGTLTDVSSVDGGVTYTGTLTPLADVEDASNVISLDQFGVQDCALNAGVGTVDSNNYAIDTKRPTASIIMADSALKAGDTSLVTITFSEAVTGFSNGDLAITNGTLTDVSSVDGGVTYTGTLTPLADVEDASNAISLDQSGVQDGAGNAGVGTVDSNNYVVDTKCLTASIILADNALKAGETSLVTITFSEAVTGFTNGDLTFSSGTLSTVSSLNGGITWTATFTPMADTTEANNVISLDQSGVQDGAGNAGVGTVGSDNYVVDTKRPTASIAVADNALKAGETSLVTITFSEAVSGFINGDLTIANGTLSAVISGDGGVNWTATFTPAAGVEDASNVISLDQTGVQDSAENAGVGIVSSGNYGIDTKCPTASIVVANNIKAGETSLVTITFSEAVSGFTNGDLTIVNGTLSAVISGDGGVTWTATFTPTAEIEDASNIISLDQTGVQDGAANIGSGAADSNNYAIDTKRPTAIILVADSALQAGETSLITFTFSEAVSGFTNGDLTIPNGTLSAVISGDGGMTWTSTFTPTADIEDASNVISLDQSGVQDGAGNAGVGTVDSSNHVIDTKRPTSTSVAVPSDGKYMAGTNLEFTVAFDENVTVTGTPRISLVIGGATVYADYAEGSGSAVLKFVYAVNAGLTDIDGITVSSLTLNSGAIDDHAGNSATLTLNSVGNTAGVLVDTVVPVSGGGGAVAVGTVASSSAALSWAAAADTSTTAADLQYKVVYSPSDNIATVTDAESNGTVAKSWTPNITSATVTGLNASTAYYFNVLVRDEAGNISAYTPVSQTTGAVYYDDPAPTTPVQPPAPPADDSGVEIIVNGEVQTGSATSTTITEDGHTTTVVVLDSERLSQRLEQEGDGATVTIPVNTGADVVVGELSGQVLHEMETREAVLEVRTESVTYTLPASQINIDDVAEQLGQGVRLQDVRVSVTIAAPPADTVSIVEDTANRNSYQVVVRPVEFQITCTSGGKTVEVSKFNGYVERTVAIPDGVDPSKITTGIVLNSDGTFSHVPTTIIKMGDKYFAKINSLTNSTYSVIWNPIEYSDVANHWAKGAVNDIGSRLIMDSDSGDVFGARRLITRDEFAATIVKALGLQPSAGDNPFVDITLGDQYYGYMLAAYEYKIMSGYPGNRFDPKRLISREEAMSMIVSAMRVTELQVSLTTDEAIDLFASYEDSSTVSSWARGVVATCLQSGIIGGRPGALIAPKDQITRAEVAAIIQRLLRQSGLI